MNKENAVVIEKRDEWSAFGEFLAGIFVKYSDEVGLDDTGGTGMIPDLQFLYMLKTERLKDTMHFMHLLL